MNEEDYNELLSVYHTQYLLVDDLLEQLESATNLITNHEGRLMYESNSSEIVSYLCGLIEGIVNVSSFQLSLPIDIPEKYTDIHSKLIIVSKEYKRTSAIITGLIIREENSEVNIKKFKEELSQNERNKRIAVMELNTATDRIE